MMEKIITVTKQTRTNITLDDEELVAILAEKFNVSKNDIKIDIVGRDGFIRRIEIVNTVIEELSSEIEKVRPI